MKNWLSEAQVADDMGVTVITLRRWVAAGKFPKPTKIGHKTIRFLVADIQRHLHAARLTARGQAPGAG